MTLGLQFGAPGVYFEPVRPIAEPQAVHLDETGFVGIAARGPINKPVKITGWSDFVRWYGGLPRRDRGEQPTLLAHAVQAYFAQGGRTAWIVRVGSTDSKCATAGFAAEGRESLRLEAANEGSWGNQLSITLRFTISAEFVVDDAWTEANATRFAKTVAECTRATVVSPDTNIVMVDVRSPMTAADVARAAAARGLLVSVWTSTRIRVVTHLDVTPAQVDEAATILREVLERG